MYCWVLTFLKTVKMASEDASISVSILTQSHCLSRTCTTINSSGVWAGWIIHSRGLASVFL